MAVRVIHFGPDECHRLTVLRSAGYCVDACGSLPELHASLEAGVTADAVFLSDGEGVEPDQAVSLARSRCSAPVILFCSTNRSYKDSSFDLVVPNLTPPEIWLSEVNSLIAETRSLQSVSNEIVHESVPRRRDAALALGKCRDERHRTGRERFRGSAFSGGNGDLGPPL